MRRSTLYLKVQRLAPLTFVVGAVACTPMLSSPPDFDVRPVSTQPSADVPADQGYYRNAVDAIKQRDYGVALNFLQAARAQENDSARVLNAFGVVYDKLGRFDLSARYYEKARAADPQSTIVAGNVAYSHVLQQLLNGDVTPTQLAAAGPASKPPVVVETQTILAPDVEMKAPQLAMAPIETQTTPSLAAMSLPNFNLGTDTGDGPVDMKAPQLAMAPIEMQTTPSLAAVSLPDLNLATDTGDRPVDMKAPHLAMAPIEAQTVPSLAALSLPDLNLATDTGDSPVDMKAPQLAMAPIETRSALSLAALPLTRFDFAADTGDGPVDIRRPVREVAVTPTTLRPEWHFDVVPQPAPLTEPQIVHANTPAHDFAFAPPPGLLVVEASTSGSNVPALKPAASQILADFGLGTRPARTAPQQAVPSEYLPLFLPDASTAAARRAEVEKIEDVPQYRAQLAAEFSTQRPQKPIAHAAEVHLAAAKRPVVVVHAALATRSAPQKLAATAQTTASRLPAHTAALIAASAQHPAAAPGNTARGTTVGTILTHHPVVIVNASTKKNAVDPIRVTLARRNWSIAPSHGTELHKLTYTTLFYAQVDYPVARALERTLTFPVRLVPDSCHCAGLRLVVGDNAVPRNRGELHATTSAQAGSSVAGLLAGTLQGARGW